MKISKNSRIISNWNIQMFLISILLLRGLCQEDSSNVQYQKTNNKDCPCQETKVNGQQSCVSMENCQTIGEILGVLFGGGVWALFMIFGFIIFRKRRKLLLNVDKRKFLAALNIDESGYHKDFSIFDSQLSNVAIDNLIDKKNPLHSSNFKEKKQQKQKPAKKLQSQKQKQNAESVKSKQNPESQNNLQTENIHNNNNSNTNTNADINANININANTQNKHKFNPSSLPPKPQKPKKKQQEEQDIIKQDTTKPIEIKQKIKIKIKEKEKENEGNIKQQKKQKISKNPKDIESQ